VKHLRFWLLLLLALLLPVRGAMAAAMVCLPQGGAHGEAAAVVEHHGGRMTPGTQDHVRHADAAGTSAAHGYDAAPVIPDDCNLCVGSCSLTTLASAPLDLRPARAQAALNAAPSVSALSVVSDGEERPPRTI
jgi:hypothetical protein